MSRSSPASLVKVRVMGVGPSFSRVQSTSISSTLRLSETCTTKWEPEVQFIVMCTEAVTFTHRVSVALAPSSSSTRRTAS